MLDNQLATAIIAATVSFIYTHLCDQLKFNKQRAAIIFLTIKEVERQRKRIRSYHVVDFDFFIDNRASLALYAPEVLSLYLDWLELVELEIGNKAFFTTYDEHAQSLLASLKHLLKETSVSWLSLLLDFVLYPVRTIGTLAKHLSKK